MSIHTEIEALQPIVLDCDHALTYVGGDPELLVQLCYNFLNELPVCVEQMQRPMAGRDYHRAGRALLQLQSCIVIFGAGHASRTAEQLKLALRERSFRPARREWSRLQLQLRDLVPQVQRLILEMATPRTAVQ